jgi:predicted dehydrogenase/threonine dehydrogenase-like Zn-dependent dehydrogenase
MKQVIQNLRGGATEVVDLPPPAPLAGHLLVATSRSLISSGTERMLVEFGKANLFAKMRQQPERVREVFAKIRTDGLMATIDAVQSKLDEPIPLGYCNVGRVLECSGESGRFRVGDRVVSNGAHAGIVRVPHNLAAAVPPNVTDDTAAFTVLGAIALQGIRLLAPTIGETVAVSGLGLIGLLAVQILRANGCRVLAIDMDANRLALAQRFGAIAVNLAEKEDPVERAQALSGGAGIDGVLIAASTESNEPVRQAAGMCRKRGRIVLVGVTGLELSRADFFKKELTFQVSCSYGPGRYDPQYEQQGHDYPIGFVRWTEQRNFEAVLGLMAAGSIDVAPLVTHRLAVADATRAYQLLTDDRASLGIVLEYDSHEAGDVHSVVPPQPPRRAVKPSDPVVGLIGAGNYAMRMLAPALQQTGARLHTVVTTGSVRGWHAARRFGFENVATDVEAVLGNREINAVVIATRHDTHAALACRALAAGKHCFVEKPLALSQSDIDAIERQKPGESVLMVGFNRRFSNLVVKARELLRASGGPHSYTYLVNAGAVPADHWSRDPKDGGGRIVGEACHFVDLLRFLDGSPIVSTNVQGMRSEDTAAEETAVITLGFASGSVGTIQYFTNGAKSFPKERLEVFSAGRILQLENFRKLRAWGAPGRTEWSRWRQDKGQLGCAQAFVDAVRSGGEAPIPFDQILEVARLTLRLDDALRSRS